MRHVARAILRLYPSAWRVRYGAEITDIVEEGRSGLRELVDLARGALDARLHPRLVATPLRLSVATPGPATGAAPTSGPVASTFGRVEGPMTGIVSRRSFLRRMLGAGVGLLSLEFLGGTIAFLWPPPADGVGVEHHVGTLDEIRGLWTRWDDGLPWEFRPARAFLVNVPAAKALALGEAPVATARSANDLLALWRKCPHLGCMVPPASEERGRFQCLCHQSTYNILGEKLKLGPAPRGMDRFPVRINDAGTVIIDTREIIKGPPTGTVTFRDAYPFEEGPR
jgi:Rieske Fe-S protein